MRIGANAKELRDGNDAEVVALLFVDDGCFSALKPRCCGPGCNLGGEAAAPRGALAGAVPAWPKHLFQRPPPLLKGALAGAAPVNLVPEKLDAGDMNLVPEKLGACDVNLVSFGQNLKRCRNLKRDVYAPEERRRVRFPHGSDRRLRSRGALAVLQARSRNNPAQPESYVLALDRQGLMPGECTRACLSAYP